MATAKKKTAEKAVEAVESVETPRKLTPKEIDINQLITVRNGFQGKLIYISKRTGEHFIWDEFGDEQDIELKELRNAKNTSKAFFSNNWFMFDEESEWVIDYLGVSQFYANAIKLSDFDELFTKPAKEIGAIVSKLSEGQKKSVEYRARQMVVSGEIDSRSAIKALEEALGVDLIERD